MNLNPLRKYKRYKYTLQAIFHMIDSETQYDNWNDSLEQTVAPKTNIIHIDYVMKILFAIKSQLNLFHCVIFCIQTKILISVQLTDWRWNEFNPTLYSHILRGKFEWNFSLRIKYLAEAILFHIVKKEQFYWLAYVQMMAKYVSLPKRQFFDKNGYSFISDEAFPIKKNRKYFCKRFEFSVGVMKDDSIACDVLSLLSTFNKQSWKT